MGIFREIQRLFKAFQKKVISFQQLVLIHVVFAIGIGLTAIAAKLVGKHFIVNTSQKSNWIEATKITNSSKMY